MPLTLTDDDIVQLQAIINKTPTEWGVQLLNFFGERQQRQKMEELKARTAAAAPPEQPAAPDPVPAHRTNGSAEPAATVQ